MTMVYFKLVILGFLIFKSALAVSDGVAPNCPTEEDLDSLTQDKFIEYLTDPCRYDKFVRPNSSDPFNVDIKMAVTHMESTLAQFTVFVNMQLEYLDNNLEFSKLSPSRSLLLGDESLKNKIWTPYILMKDLTKTTVVGIEQKETLVAIEPTGQVTYSYKMVASFTCSMDLQKFPFDHQKCTVTFSDWSYNSTNLQLNWNKNSPITLMENLHFSEYIIDGVEYSSESNFGPYQTKSSLNVGNFSEITIDFRFHRDVGYYLFDFFIPSYLLVCTAWVTFWLQADAGPPRAVLGASTVVAFITLHVGLTKDIPKVSYVKASDIWFLAVILFIFLSLAEFAFVNVIWRRRKQIELKKNNHKYILKSAFMPRKAREDLKRYESSQTISTICQSNDSLNSMKPEMNGHTTIAMPDQTPDFTWTRMTPKEVAIYVDRKARIVFPVAFLIFNILYWTFVYCV